jgi:hypothetical protein
MRNRLDRAGWSFWPVRDDGPAEDALRHRSGPRQSYRADSAQTRVGIRCPRSERRRRTIGGGSFPPGWTNGGREVQAATATPANRQQDVGSELKRTTPMRVNKVEPNVGDCVGTLLGIACCFSDYVGCKWNATWDPLGCLPPPPFSRKWSRGENPFSSNLLNFRHGKKLCPCTCLLPDESPGMQWTKNCADDAFVHSEENRSEANQD